MFAFRARHTAFFQRKRDCAKILQGSGRVHGLGFRGSGLAFWHRSRV